MRCPLLALAFAALASPCRGDFITAYATSTGDATIVSGSATTLSLPGLMTAGGSPAIIGAARIYLGGIAPVTAASLTFVVASSSAASGAPISMEVSGVGTGVGGVGFDDFSMTTAPLGVVVVPANVSDPRGSSYLYRLDATSLVAAAVAAGDLEVEVFFADVTPGTSVTLDGIDAYNPLDWPVLGITTVPEPGSAAMLGLGLGLGLTGAGCAAQIRWIGRPLAIRPAP